MRTCSTKRARQRAIDARDIFTKSVNDSGHIDRAHREFTDEQIQNVADVVRRYRGEKAAGDYEDIKGLCRVATLDDIRTNGYSLTTGRYVGVAEIEEEEYDFKESLTQLNNKLNDLNKQSQKFEKVIEENVTKLLR